MTHAHVMWSAERVGHKIHVKVRRGEEHLFVDECSAGGEASRTRLLDRLIQRLPAMEQEREAVANRLRTLAARPHGKAADDHAPSLVPGNPEAWDEEVDGTEMLDDLVVLLKEHLVLPDHAPEAIALWIAHTFVYESFTYTPRLLFTSPDKRCGKSLALRLVSALSSRPLRAGNTTPAAMFRSIEEYRPTLLLDEADTYLVGRNAKDELRGIIDEGFENGGVVLRCVGDEHKPMPFRVFCPLVIGGIGAMPGTVEDRSLIIRMRRKHKDERVKRLRAGTALRDQVTDQVRRLVRWARDNLQELEAASPPIPEQLDDRAGNVWFVLLAIADVVGGAWQARARAAAIALSTGRDDDESIGVVLLRDCCRVFADMGRSTVRSADLVERLTQIDESPWGDYRGGREISAQQVARLLKPFGISPQKWKNGGKTDRGYQCSDFEDAVGRYAPELLALLRQLLEAPPAPLHYAARS